MRLAKQHLDIGLFTNDIADQGMFWARKAGLRLDHELEMGPGWTQHRFDAHGSVIKVNHRAAPLPSRPRSGFVGLSIAQPGRRRATRTQHPGGDEVALVPPGRRGVEKIGITIASADPERLLDFYCTAMDFLPLGRGLVQCGDTLVSIIDGEGGSDVDDFAAEGFRYITVQVFDADLEMKQIVARGGRVVRDATNFAGVARYGFVSDPDGNWIEISARTSLTGVSVS